MLNSITTFILANLNTFIMSDARDLFSEANELVELFRVNDVLSLSR
jgi:hypothetical protein